MAEARITYIPLTQEEIDEFGIQPENGEMWIDRENSEIKYKTLDGSEVISLNTSFFGQPDTVILNDRGAF